MENPKKLTRREKIIIGCAVGAVAVTGVIFLVYVKNSRAKLRLIEDTSKFVKDLSDRTHLMGTDIPDRTRLTSTGIMSLIDGNSNTVNNAINITDSVVSVYERIGRGHPGYMIKHLETGDIYESQIAAAKALGISPSRISDHLNGRTADVFGNTFRRIVANPNYDLAA